MGWNWEISLQLVETEVNKDNIPGVQELLMKPLGNASTNAVMRKI